MVLRELGDQLEIKLAIKRALKPKLVNEYLDVFMVKIMKNSEEFYHTMLQAIVNLNGNTEYHKEIAIN